MPLVGSLTACMHYPVRQAFKKQHGIVDKNPCGEICCMICCDACLLCQEIRELEIRQPAQVVMVAPPTLIVAPQMNPMMAAAPQYAQPQYAQPQQPMGYPQPQVQYSQKQ